MPRGGSKEGVKHSPVTYSNQLTFKDEEEKHELIERTLSHNLKYMDRKRVASEEEWLERFNNYINDCINDGCRPTWEGLALAQGTIRQVLWEWETGRKHGPVSADLVKKSKEFMSCFDAEMVQAGKLNPVAYIFRSKNYYGMKDQQEVVVAPSTGSASTADLIKAAEELPDEDIQTVE